MKLPVGVSAYRRDYGRAPEIKLVNRFFETNPANQIEGSSLLSRPATVFETSAGDGPVRACFAAPGLFEEDLFFVSNDELFRYDGTDVTQIIGSIAGTGAPRMAGIRGAGYERLFIADGVSLQYFGGALYTAVLTASGTIADDVVVIDGVHFQFAAALSSPATAATATLSLGAGDAAHNDTIVIDGVYYRFENDGLQSGDGTQARPYWVKSNRRTDAFSMNNLAAAINGTGTVGTQYGSGVVPHPTVRSTSNTASQLVVTAITPGPSGNNIDVSVVIGNNQADGFSWGSATLTGGSAVVDDGTVSTPYLVNKGASNAQALENLRKAINASGVPGTDYSNTITEPPAGRVQSNANTATTVTVRAKDAGQPAPDINVSVITTGSSDGLSWSSSTLQSPPTDNAVLYTIPTPDDVGIIAVTAINSFILCAVAGSQRVYFIRPGSVEIDPLDFFEAESEPDQLVDIITVGDQVWCIGQASTDVYYPTGDNAAPFARAEGRPFSRGAIPGTSVKLADSVVLVGDDNIVYRLTGGPQPISTHGISERVRKMREQQV